MKRKQIRNQKPKPEYYVDVYLFIYSFDEDAIAGAFTYMSAGSLTCGSFTL